MHILQTYFLLFSLGESSSPEPEHYELLFSESENTTHTVPVRRCKVLL